MLIKQSIQLYFIYTYAEISSEAYLNMYEYVSVDLSLSLSTQFVI